MGQVVRTDFSPSFQATSALLNVSTIRGRQVLSNRFDSIRLFNFSVGNVNQEFNYDVRKIGEIWMAGYEEESGAENKVCDGTAYNPALFPEAFSKIGYKFGQDTETGFFLVPDFRDRVPVGDSETYAIGVQYGEENYVGEHGHAVTLTIAAHSSYEIENPFTVTVASAGSETNIPITGTGTFEESVGVELAVLTTTTTYSSSADGTFEIEISGTTETALGTTAVTHTDADIREGVAHTHSIPSSPISVEVAAEGGVNVVEYPVSDTDGFEVVLGDITHNALELEHDHGFEGSDTIDVSHTHEGTATGSLLLSGNVTLDMEPLSINTTHTHIAGLEGSITIPELTHSGGGTAESTELVISVIQPSLAVRFLIKLK